MDLGFARARPRTVGLGSGTISTALGGSARATGLGSGANGGPGTNSAGFGAVGFGAACLNGRAGRPARHRRPFVSSREDGFGRGATCASEVDPPWIIAARQEARSAAATGDGVADYEGAPESDAGPPWPVSAGVRRPLAARTLINGEPIIRTTLSGLSEEESASRSGGGLKIRGPPRR